MSQDNQPQHKSQYSRFQSTLHIGMGFVYLILGVVVLYIKYFGSMALSPSTAYSIGTLLIIYGVFRLWRGIMALRQQKNN